MLGVCFRAEDRPVYQDQWSYLFSNFGVKDIWEMGESTSIYQATQKIETAAELPEGSPLVVVQPPDGRWVKGTESLSDFVHPDEAIYMFGASNAVMTLEDLGGRVAEHYVYIPLASHHECFAFSAAYMTLWDRKTKNG